LICPLRTLNKNKVIKLLQAAGSVSLGVFDFIVNSSITHIVEGLTVDRFPLKKAKVIEYLLKLGFDYPGTALHYAHYVLLLHTTEISCDETFVRENMRGTWVLCRMRQALQQVKKLSEKRWIGNSWSNKIHQTVPQPRLPSWCCSKVGDIPIPPFPREENRN
jgi:hypothetical protein